MSHKTHMAAMNAARKEFGKAWKDFAECRRQIDGSWIVELRENEHREITAFDPTVDHFERLWDLISKAIKDVLWLDSLVVIRKEIDAAYNAGAISMEQFTALCTHSAKLQDAKTDSDIAAEELKAEAIANSQASETGKPGKVWIRLSSAPKPTKLVWAIADEMNKAAADAGEEPPSRKEVQEECVRRGIASGTARTQYQAWKTANDNDRKNAEAAAAASARVNGK